MWAKKIWFIFLKYFPWSEQYKTWLLFLSLPPEHTTFLIQFYNVKSVKKNPSLILYLGQKWAPIEINGKNCNLEHSKMSLK